MTNLFPLNIVFSEDFEKRYKEYSAKLLGFQRIEEKTASNKPTIRLKTLELISRAIGDLDSANNLIIFLRDCGINQSLIEYPQTKWRMIYSILSKLATSGDKKDKEMLFKIIGSATHPIIHQGNKESADALREKFNEYLNYDNLGIRYDKKEANYFVARNASDEEMGDILLELSVDAIEQEQKELDFLCKPENKEKISTLRKAYQIFMNIVEVFCESPSKPTHELNDAYINTKKLITDVVNDLHLYTSKVNGVQRIHALRHYCIPFNNLFTAESEYKDHQKGKLNWDVLRPQMHATYGDIDELYRKVNGSDILAEPDIQKKLNDTQLYLSKLREKNAEIKKQAELQITPTAKIEITNMPELRIGGLDKLTKTKEEEGKPKFPHKLPAGTKWDNFTMKFLDDENVFIQVKQFKHNASYKEMGFVGKGNNPNPSEAWTFLKVLAKVNGELTIKDTEARDKYKKQKELLAKSLQGYFSLDYDPFYPYRSSSEKQGNSYKIKITLVPPPADSKKSDAEEDKDNLGLKGYLDDQAPQVYEDE